MSTHVILGCPCCGEDGAVSNARGEFIDGQPLICGCEGWVSIDPDDGPWINASECPCDLAILNDSGATL